MQATVNNCLMNNNSEVSDVSLEKIKNVLVMFEKKKRNLDKRKTKLEDYKKKKDLNEDQQLAVSKYGEVVSNMELLEEFTSQTNIQFKEAEKAAKKQRKQEKSDKKKHEINLLEMSFKYYHLLDRLCPNEKLQNKIVSDNAFNSSDITILNKFYAEISANNCDWKKSATIFHNLFEGGSKNVELGMNKTLDVTNESLLTILSKLEKVEWLTSNAWRDILIERNDPQPAVVDALQSDEELYDAESGTEQEVEQHQEPEQVIPAPQVEPPQPECHKMSFVFLHDSMVTQDLVMNKHATGTNENGLPDNHRPESQLSGKSGHFLSKNTAWNSVEDNYEPSQQGCLPHDDVFSNATQSEFMQQGDAFGINMKKGNVPVPLNSARSGSNHWQSPNPNNTSQGVGNTRFARAGFNNGGGNGGGQNGGNYWRGGSGRNFNNPGRFPRSNRSGGGSGANRGGGGRGGNANRGNNGGPNRFHTGQPLSAK